MTAQYLSNGDWLPYKHLIFISSIITAAIAGGNARFVFTMPPRHGKSEFISHWIPIWFLNGWPYKRILLASYEANFAAEWGRKVRDDIETLPELSIRVNPAARATNNFYIHKDKGGMKTAGIGGAFTGKGADLFIIDDPVKNWADAMSEATRNRHKSWYDSTAKTRLEPNASIIVLMTRWHEDDLGGYLINEKGFTEIRLPAIAEEKDPLGRKPGEALCPERYPVKVLEEIKKESILVWNGLYQGRPTALEGNLFKRKNWRYYDVMPLLKDFTEIIQSWDLAFKDHKDSDYVVGAVWGRIDEFYYLLDIVRGQWSFNKSCEEFKKLCIKWPQARKKLVEAKANGDALDSSLKRKISGIKLVEPAGGKIARAFAAEPSQCSGNVWLPNRKTHPAHIQEWVDKFVHEASQFPNADNDDQVDTFSQAIIHFEGGNSDRLRKLGQM